MSIGPFTYRSATPEDADEVVPLMYASSATMIEYSFGVGDGRAVEFLRRAFTEDRGLFACSRQFVAADGAGSVVATVTAYPGRALQRLTFESVRVAFRHYRPRDLAVVVRRALVVNSLFVTPPSDALFLANGCVRKSDRGAGVFSALLAERWRVAKGDRVTGMELDVSFSNAAAQRLYTRLGFSVVEERPYSGSEPLEGFRRMRWAPVP